MPCIAWLGPCWWARVEVYLVALPPPPHSPCSFFCRASLTMSWPPSTGMWAAPLLEQQVLLLFLLLLQGLG